MYPRRHQLHRHVAYWAFLLFGTRMEKEKKRKENLRSRLRLGLCFLNSVVSDVAPCCAWQQQHHPRFWRQHYGTRCRQTWTSEAPTAIDLSCSSQNTEGFRSKRKEFLGLHGKALDRTRMFKINHDPFLVAVDGHLHFLPWRHLRSFTNCWRGELRGQTAEKLVAVWRNNPWSPMYSHQIRTAEHLCEVTVDGQVARLRLIINGTFHNFSYFSDFFGVVVGCAKQMGKCCRDSS